jgi:hypothetical protein
MAIVRGTLQDINDIYPTGLGPIVPLESMSPSGVVTVPPVVASHPGTNGGLLARTTATTTGFFVRVSFTNPAILSEEVASPAAVPGWNMVDPYVRVGTLVPGVSVAPSTGQVATLTVHSAPAGHGLAVEVVEASGRSAWLLTDQPSLPAGVYDVTITVEFDEQVTADAAVALTTDTSTPLTVVDWGFITADPPAPTSIAPGTINMSVPQTEWEPSRCAHSWLLPQRVNMVANPSFEVDVNGLLNGVTYSKLYELSGDAEGDMDVTIGLTAGTFGTGTFGSGTFGLPGAPSDPDVKVWVFVFDAAGADPKVYDILPDPWFTLRSDGWLVAITTVEPTSVEISSIAAGLDKTGALAGTRAIGTFNAVLYGISGVDLTSEESLVIVAGAEFNTGIVAVGFDTNQLGGTTVVSNPLIPEAGEHVNGRFVMQIAGRWVPSSASNYLVQFGTEPLSFTGLPNPTTPGNENKVTEILTMEFLSTVPLAAFGWRTNGDIDIVNSSTVGVPGPRPLGSGARPKSGHITGGDPYEYLPSIGSIEAVTMNRIVLESNLFPTAVSQDRFMSLEAQVAGTGLARIGLVTWDPAKLVPSYTHGPWVSVSSDAVFHPLRHLVQLPDRAEEACFRLEFLGEEMWVDNVLVDNNAAQLGFFDGDWHTGMQGDFSWYGSWGDTGAIVPYAPDPLMNLRNRSYSLYYNDRRNQDAYLFGYTEEVAKDGAVFDLAPYGAVSSPTIIIDENASVQEARDKLLATGLAGATLGVTHLIPDPGTPGGLVPELLGQLDLTDLTVLRRVGGAAWGYVPEGADVIPQWDEVYGIRLPCWPGELFIPVKDVSSTPVTEIEEI